MHFHYSILFLYFDINSKLSIYYCVLKAKNIHFDYYSIDIFNYIL